MYKKIEIITSLLIVLFLALGCSEKEDPTATGIAGFNAGMNLENIPECASKPISGSKYYCSISGESAKLGSISTDDFTLTFNSEKKLIEIAIGIYGNENVIEELEQLFGEFNEIKSFPGDQPTGDYTFKNEEVDITYQVMYQTPGQVTATTNKRDDAVKYHMVIVRFED
ncbi:hypothetical protein [Gracilimonas sediminicola]|uniref:hypothetical protein n=1 Tax=Gracilimonas sediminicola TaxID=2952158 RepID=UPI0038D4E891